MLISFKEKFLLNYKSDTTVQEGGDNKHYHINDNSKFTY